MVLLFWDASAISKRYTLENGYPTVDALFEAVPTFEMGSTHWGYAETFSILLRRRNGGVLNEITFQKAVSDLQQETILNNDFVLLDISAPTIISSTGMMQKHNLNATDSAILMVLLAFSRSANAPVCLLLASDQRLLRAATAEGLPVINPENVVAPDALTLCRSFA